MRKVFAVLGIVVVLFVIMAVPALAYSVSTAPGGYTFFGVFPVNVDFTSALRYQGNWLNRYLNVRDIHQTKFTGASLPGTSGSDGVYLRRIGDDYGSVNQYSIVRYLSDYRSTEGGELPYSLTTRFSPDSSENRTKQYKWSYDTPFYIRTASVYNGFNPPEDVWDDSGENYVYRGLRWSIEDFDKSCLPIVELVLTVSSASIPSCSVKFSAEFYTIVRDSEGKYNLSTCSVRLDNLLLASENVARQGNQLACFTFPCFLPFEILDEQGVWSGNTEFLRREGVVYVKSYSMSINYFRASDSVPLDTNSVNVFESSVTVLGNTSTAVQDKWTTWYYQNLSTRNISFIGSLVQTIGEAVDGFFSIKVFGLFSIGEILYVILALSVLFFFMRIFLGG